MQPQLTAACRAAWHSAMPIFGDADGDGDADLLVANTINYPEFLYRNDGDRFVQVMETAPSLAGGFTEGVNWIDYDNDGDLDIFAARSNGPNALYHAGPTSTATAGSMSSSSTETQKTTQSIAIGMANFSSASRTALSAAPAATAAVAYSLTLTAMAIRICMSAISSTLRQSRRRGNVTSSTSTRETSASPRFKAATLSSHVPSAMEHRQPMPTTMATSTCS
jgi:hypothetical protein